MTATPRPPHPPAPLTDAERDELQALLDRVPAPLEPLDVSMLDGFLCGVLVQPQAIAASRWLPHVTDADGRTMPADFDARRLRELAERRHAELNAAIGARQWFDPWVFELSPEPGAAADGDVEDDEEDDGFDPAAADAVYPWVAGFATALELFPALLRTGSEAALTEPLALLYRHLDPDDLEDAEALIETIDSLEPPADLAEAVEGLVRATLLLADVGRPIRSGAPAKTAQRPRRGTRTGPPRRSSRTAPRRR
jgi:uncharacterized protein